MGGKSSKEEHKSEDDLPGYPQINFVEMKERRRRMIRIILINRRDFRMLFGITFANKWGHFTDQWMSRCIHRYCDWINYPKGNYVLEGHKGSVFASVISNDGYYLFTGSSDTSIIMWDLRTNLFIQRWKAHEINVVSLAYHNGCLVSGQSTIRLWDVRGPKVKLVRIMKGHSEAVRSLEFDSSGSRILSGSRDKSIRLWSVKTGRCLRVYSGHIGFVSRVHFIGDHLISGSSDRSTNVWNPQSGRVIRSIRDDIGRIVYDVCINRDRTKVACLLGTGITVYQWPTMAVIRTFDLLAYYGQFHPIHPDLLAVSEHSKYKVVICNVASGDCVCELEGHSRPIRSVCFTPDGCHVVSTAEDQTTRLFDVSAL